ncbi:MAG: GNAT family acetyltransferase [Gammaproteobacteria bacterium]|nr:GNAT family acetyltransferase [Gammaproteobacteria bacterium]
MQIRKFEQTDFQALTNFWKQTFPDEPAHNRPDLVIAEKLQHDDLVFVAHQNNELVGACMAGYDGHRGWLYTVAVHPQQRRQGIGRALVAHALAELKSMRCVKINLQVRASNANAVKFYQALGFSTEERISMGKLL